MHHHNRQLPAHACYLQVGSALALAASPLAAVWMGYAIAAQSSATVAKHRARSSTAGVWSSSVPAERTFETSNEPSVSLATRRRALPWYRSTVVSFAAIREPALSLTPVPYSLNYHLSGVQRVGVTAAQNDSTSPLSKAWTQGVFQHSNSAE